MWGNYNIINIGLLRISRDHNLFGNDWHYMCSVKSWDLGPWSIYWIFYIYANDGIPTFWKWQSCRWLAEAMDFWKKSSDPCWDADSTKSLVCVPWQKLACKQRSLWLPLHFNVKSFFVSWLYRQRPCCNWKWESLPLKFVVKNACKFKVVKDRILIAYNFLVWNVS